MTKRSGYRNQLLNEVEGAENTGTLPTRIRWIDPRKAKRRAGRRGARRPRPLQSGSGARHHPPFTANPIPAEWGRAVAVRLDQMNTDVASALADIIGMEPRDRVGDAGMQVLSAGSPKGETA